MKLFSRTKYITFSLFVVFLLCESYLRIFKHENLILHSYPKVYAFDKDFGYRGIPNIEGYIRRPGIEKRFIFNAFGLNNKNFSASHPDSIFRIMIAGASLVEGTWARQNETYVSLLNDKFKAEGYKVEVINCGISGSDRGLQNIAYAKELAAKFRPNLVLYELSFPMTSVNYARDRYKNYSILFTGNDLKEFEHSRFVAERKIDLIEKRQLITDLYDMSYCMRFLCRAIDDGRNWGTIVNCCRIYGENKCDSWQYYASTSFDAEKGIELMNKLAAELGEMGCRLAPFEYYNDFKDSLSGDKGKLGFSTISLNVNLNDEKYHLELDDHLNLHGDQVIADSLFSRLHAAYIPISFFPR
jgi:hypothetical protein